VNRSKIAVTHRFINKNTPHSGKNPFSIATQHPIKNQQVSSMLKKRVAIKKAPGAIPASGTGRRFRTREW
jgi:hypothetical protein